MSDLATVEARGATDPLILALDVGTSSSRAIVYDGQGRAIRGYEKHVPYQAQTTPHGGVQLDANALAEAVGQGIDGALRAAGEDAGRIRAVAYSNFWHSLMGVRGTQAVTPVYTFADTRSVQAAQELAKQLDPRAIHARTGAWLHSSYWPAKLLWLKQSQSDLYESVDGWISFAEYLYLQYFGDRRVSISMASGTGLFDQNRCDWDDTLLQALHLSPKVLFPLADFDETFQHLCEPYAQRWPALRDVPWYLAVGDGACNNIGSGATDASRVVAMIGTSGAIRVIREMPRIEIAPGLWTYRVDRRRFVQGGAFSNGGNVYQWLENTLQLPNGDDLDRKLAGMKPDSHGLTVLPYLAGERSPHFNPNADAVITGMRLDTGPLDFALAWFEAVAYQFGAVYEILRKVLPQDHSIIGSGAGLLHSPAWMQIMTDVMAHPITASTAAEASSRGAALLVLEALGALPSVGGAPVPLGETFDIRPDAVQIYRAAMHRQEALYQRVISPPPSVSFLEGAPTSLGKGENETVAGTSPRQHSV